MMKNRELAPQFGGNWKIINSKLHRHGSHVYACQDCPARYMKIYEIENQTTQEVRKICEGCAEPYFRNYEPN